MYVNRLLIVLTSLHTTTFGITISLHTDDVCGGANLRCTNVEPHTCCGYPGRLDSADIIAAAVGFEAIESTADVTCRAARDHECIVTRHTLPSNARSRVCLRHGPFRSGHYYVNDELPLELGQKRPCVRPDLAELADGTTFDLSGAEDVIYDNMVRIALNATTIAEVPAEYRQLQKRV